METKERFLTTALDLFSRSGYAGVSVRDITGALGMRESALYKHYRSKAEVLEKIIERAAERIRDFEGSAPRPSGPLAEAVGDWFVRIVRFYTEDPFLSRFRRFMMISRYESEAANERFRDMFLNKSLRYYKEVHRTLFPDGTELDAKVWALQLYAPLFLILFADGGEAADCEALLRAHVRKFFADNPCAEANWDDR